MSPGNVSGTSGWGAAQASAGCCCLTITNPPEKKSPSSQEESCRAPAFKGDSLRGKQVIRAIHEQAAIRDLRQRKNKRSNNTFLSVGTEEREKKISHFPANERLSPQWLMILRAPTRSTSSEFTPPPLTFCYYHLVLHPVWGGSKCHCQWSVCGARSRHRDQLSSHPPALGSRRCASASHPRIGFPSTGIEAAG